MTDEAMYESRQTQPEQQHCCRVVLINLCFATIVARLATRGWGVGMDPQSIRALACVAKNPFGGILQSLIDEYATGHRERSLLITMRDEATWRCIKKVGSGRCRKRVSEVALAQYCGKRQTHSPFVEPKDKSLTHWNYHNLVQKKRLIE